MQARFYWAWSLQSIKTCKRSCTPHKRLVSVRQSANRLYEHDSLKVPEKYSIRYMGRTLTAAT